MTSSQGVSHRINEKSHDVSTEYVEYFDSKKAVDINVLERQETDSSSLESDEKIHTKPPSTALDLVTEILEVKDDPTQNPWTFRLWFIGIGMSVFAG
jgi:hypothetical protein